MFDRNQLIDLLWRNRMLFALIFLASLGLAAAALLLSPQRYLASSLLSLDARPGRSVEEIVQSGRLTTGTAARSLEQLAPSAVAGEINALRSPVLLGRVIGELDLANDEEFGRSGLLNRIHGLVDGLIGSDDAGGLDTATRQINAIRHRLDRQLTVEAPRQSTQIHVSVKSRNPETARAIVEHLVDGYLDEQVQAKISVARRTSQQLAVAVQDALANSTDAQRQVQAFREQHGLVAGGPLSPAAQRLSELVAAEQKARIEADNERERLALLRARGNSAAAAAALGSSKGQQQLASLTATQSDLQARLASESASLGAAHPRVRQLQDQLNSVRGELEKLRVALLTSQGDAVTESENNHRRLATALAQARGELTQENALEAQLIQLEGEARVRQAVFEETLGIYNRALAIQHSAVPDFRVLYTNVEPASSRLGLLLISPLPALLLALAITLLLGRRRSARRPTPQQIEQATGAPLLAALPEEPALANARPSTAWQLAPASSAHAEAVRGLRNALDIAEAEAQVIAIVSARPGEGRTTLATALASACVAGGHATLIIDANIAQADETDRRDASELDAGKPGAGKQLDAGAASRRPRIRHCEALGFDYLSPAGSGPLAAGRFSRRALDRALAQLRPRYERIILDLPPVLAAADAAVGAALADRVLFVTRPSGAGMTQLIAACDQFRRLGIARFDLVLNRCSGPINDATNPVRRSPYKRDAFHAPSPSRGAQVSPAKQRDPGPRTASHQPTVTASAAPPTTRTLVAQAARKAAATRTEQAGPMKPMRPMTRADLVAADFDGGDSAPAERSSDRH